MSSRGTWGACAGGGGADEELQPDGAGEEGMDGEAAMPPAVLTPEGVRQLGALMDGIEHDFLSMVRRSSCIHSSASSPFKESQPVHNLADGACSFHVRWMSCGCQQSESEAWHPWGMTSLAVASGIMSFGVLAETMCFVKVR